MDLAGKVALVTGGGTGLGREISLELGRAGADVVINYSRSRDDANETVKRLEDMGRRAVSVRADLHDGEAIKYLANEAFALRGRLDILVNDAGTTVFVPHDDLDAISDEDWDRIMSLNVKAPWRLIKASVPLMRQNGGGKVISVTSVSGTSTEGSSVPYCVSKAAMNHLTRVLAEALAPDILVNAVAPGMALTRWYAWADQATIDGVVQKIPLKKTATPADVATAVRFLAENDHVTGHILTVDGGQSVR